jgi:hypothetical protein
MSRNTIIVLLYHRHKRLGLTAMRRYIFAFDWGLKRRNCFIRALTLIKSAAYRPMNAFGLELKREMCIPFGY